VVCDRQAKNVADSFTAYILDLGKTFEYDFVRYQPNLGFLDSLQKGKREQFNAEFQQAFERYLKEKIAEWELTAEKQIADAFAKLGQSAASYGANYHQVTRSMNEKLTGQKINRVINTELEEECPSWASWAMGFFSLTTGNVAGVVMASAGFDWKNILVNYVAVIGISSFLLLFAGSLASIGLIGIPLLGLGVGALQADEARKEFIKTTKKEFVKYLPEFAQSQWPTIYDLVKQGFDEYEFEVMKRVNNDIKSRQAELDNLVAQKKYQEIDYSEELSRLKTLDAEVLSQLKTIESAYQDLLSSPV
jgi:replication fork clamp-binding protein CrfC